MVFTSKCSWLARWFLFVLTWNWHCNSITQLVLFFAEHEHCIVKYEGLVCIAYIVLHWIELKPNMYMCGYMNWSRTCTCVVIWTEAEHVHVWLYELKPNMYMCGYMNWSRTCTCVVIWTEAKHVHVWLYELKPNMYMCGYMNWSWTCTCVVIWTEAEHVHVWLYELKPNMYMCGYMNWSRTCTCVVIWFNKSDELGSVLDNMEAFALYHLVLVFQYKHVHVF